MGDRALAGKVRLTAARGPLRGSGLTVVLAADPEVDPGVGGWERFARPGRRPGIWWPGGAEASMTIEGFFERTIGDVQIPIATRIRRLIAMGSAMAGEVQPTPVRLTGDVTDPYSRRGGLWVITNVALGARRWEPDGRLRRHGLTIALGEYDTTPSIKPVTVRRTRSSVRRPRVRVVRSRKGDTLRAIAVRELGYSGGWQKIAEWNPRLFRGSRPTGPDDPLKAGLAVRLE